MKKEELIEVLRKEREDNLKTSEYMSDEKDKEYYRGKASAINTIICMLKSKEYYKLIAKQNGIEVK